MMKKLLLTLLTAAAATCMSAAVTPTLYGNLIYNSQWGAGDSDKAGIYSFTADQAGDVELVYTPDGSYIYGNGGAVYVDGKYYVLTHVPETNITANTLYTYNADTWTLDGSVAAPLTTSANDLTWCPVDKKVYGVFLSETKSGYVFGTLNLNDGTVNVIKALDLRDTLGPMPMLTLASNAQGEIYGVGADGNLYRFDRTTGEATLVGDTGYKPARWNQSACFDFTTGELYWAACNNDSAVLLKLDTATGAGTTVRTFSHDEEFVGLYTIGSVADLKGPQAPENLKVDLQGNALTGTLSFTLPTVTISGEALTGNLDYVVEDNGVELVKGSGAVGSAVSKSVTLTEGLHSLVAYCTTADGRGATTRVAVYAGNDVPVAPAAVTATLAGEKVNISWDAVTKGFYNGYIDASAVTYTVTRMPDNKVIAKDITATTCADENLPASLGDYTYSVVASCAGKASAATVSAPVTLGASMVPPVAMDLTDEEQFKFFTVVDANEDNKTWVWTINGIKADYDRNNASDDWLISPAVNLKAGYQYIITYELRAGNSRYEETFEIMAGNSPSPEALTIPLIADGATKNTTRYPLEITYVPEADGDYYFGFHCTSPKYQYCIYVYTFSVSEPFYMKAPVASEEVSATAAEKGALEATITAKAPLKAIDGSDLTALVKAEVKNLTTGKIAGTVENPALGATVSVTDKEAVNGVNKYAVAFYVEGGKGYDATTEVYVGEDTPGLVTDVVLKQEGEKAILTWVAPLEGVNGGYVDAANLTYRVVDAVTGKDLATGLNEATYTDESQDAKQHEIQYAVYASNVAGEGKGAKSNVLVYGTPLAVPFAESFAGGKLSTEPWTTVVEGSGYPDWLPSKPSMYDTTDPSQDGDNGWMKYSSKGTVTLCTPVLNISSLDKPAVKFWYRADMEESPVDMEVLVTTDRGLTWTSLDSKTVTDVAWTPLTVDLSSVKGNDAIMVGFKASTTSYNDMHIDNVRITNNNANDLALTAFSGPASLDAGASATYTVRLTNEGTSAAKGYTVEISSGDQVLGSAEGEEIAADASATVEVEVTLPINFEGDVLVATVKYEGDEFDGNDKAELALEVVAPRLPVIESLVAVNSADGISLSWERPAEERNPSAATDDLESLTAWDFGGVDYLTHEGMIGDYKVYDEDGGATVVANTWFLQPNSYKPMAYQVNKTGGMYPEVDLTNYSINARSGNYSLIAWGPDLGESSDWLILPELYPGETKISFWAHAASMSYGSGATIPEKLEVLYSTTGNEITDFTSFVANVDVPAGFDDDPEKGFKFYSYTLPEDTKYAAIRVSLSTTTNKAVVIDDITFTPATAPKEALEIKGYNVYRDGAKIAETEAESYVDTEATGSHVYNVTTRYHLGESLFSNNASAAMSGVENISVENGNVRFYNLQGREVINPVKGQVYIVVRHDGSTFKHLLR